MSLNIKVLLTFLILALPVTASDPHLPDAGEVRQSKQTTAIESLQTFGEELIEVQGSPSLLTPDVLTKHLRSFAGLLDLRNKANDMDYSELLITMKANPSPIDGKPLQEKDNKYLEFVSKYFTDTNKTLLGEIDQKIQRFPQTHNISVQEYYSEEEKKRVTFLEVIKTTDQRILWAKKEKQWLNSASDYSPLSNLEIDYLCEMYRHPAKETEVYAQGRFAIALRRLVRHMYRQVKMNNPDFKVVNSLEQN